MVEIVSSEQIFEAADIRIIEAFRNTIQLYGDKDINNLWNDIKDCKFNNHDVGKGINFIWISRKVDGKRIAVITNKID